MKPCQKPCRSRNRQRPHFYLIQIMSLYHRRHRRSALLKAVLICLYDWVLLKVFYNFFTIAKMFLDKGRRDFTGIPNSCLIWRCEILKKATKNHISRRNKVIPNATLTPFICFDFRHLSFNDSKLRTIPTSCASPTHCCVVTRKAKVWWPRLAYLRRNPYIMCIPATLVSFSRTFWWRWP